MTEGPEARYRLPRSVVPSRYDLVIEPDLDVGRFGGSVDIAVSVVEPVDEIVLNARGLEIDGGRLVDPAGEEIDVEKVLLDEGMDRATLVLAGTARPGEHELHLEFRGPINEELRGFYRSTYEDPDGTTHLVAATHFEATDARRAFPCWDEPDLKAVFGITLVVPEGLVALSNGPEVGREPAGDGRVRVRFADTMKMSTYLVAYVVGRLELTDPVDADGAPLRVAYVPGKRRLAEYALVVGAFCMRFFREYYGIAYPDRKMDFVALPEFAAGAMENTGCITYREWLLLVEPTTATQLELLNVVETIAHEVAHQWFGNLVTMRWWNGIWLNEAFATFMSMLAVDAFRPDWERWNSFQRSRSVAFETDAVLSTRPIEYAVSSPNDIDGMFDTLTYVKGGAILRMLERYLGGERFRDGIRAYLETHAYGNTETHDLWDSIEASSKEPVRRIMDSFIWQGGYPLLTATASDGTLKLVQQRFLLSGRSDDTRWSVPLLVRNGGSARPVLIEAESLEIPLEDPNGAVVVNAGAGSFVRVRYEPALLDRLRSSLDDLTVGERYQLVDDLLASVFAGQFSASEFCRFVEAFAEEDDPSVWQAIVGALAWFHRFVEGDVRVRFQAFVRGLVGPALERLGWEPGEDESDLTRTLRGTLFSSLAVLGADANVIAMAREMEAEARAGQPLDPSMAAASVSVVAIYGGPDEYESFLRSWQDRPSPQEQLRYLQALAAFRDPGLLERTLGYALSEEVRHQDGPFVWAAALTNRDLGAAAWRFERAHWAEAERRFPFNLMIRVADGVRFLTLPEQAGEAAAFFAEHPIPQNAKTLAQILEKQAIAVGLRERATLDLADRFSG